MEGLAPPLKFCLDLELKVEMGTSVRSAVYEILKNSAHDDACDFLLLVRDLVRVHDHLGEPLQIAKKAPTSYQRAVLELIVRGLRGEPILLALRIVQKELEIVCQNELDRYMRRLPLLALVPLLTFQLPAFLILLFGPLLHLFTRGLS